MPDEAHSAADTLLGLSLIDDLAPVLHTHRLFYGAAGDADFLGDVHQLIEREAMIGRVFDETIEARGDINDVANFVPWEPPILLLRIHNEESTGTGRSVLRQVDIDHVETSQTQGAVTLT